MFYQFIHEKTFISPPLPTTADRQLRLPIGSKLVLKKGLTNDVGK